MSDSAEKRPRQLGLRIVVGVGLLALGGAVALPNFVKARTTSCSNSCIANLRQIEGAKQQWAIENRKEYYDAPEDADLFGPSLYLKEKPVCPADGTYVLGRVGEVAACTVAEHAL